MVPGSSHRAFFNSIIARFGSSSICSKVAKIYGPPDDTLSLGPLETWYYFNVHKGFVFKNGELEQIVPLRVPRR